MRDNVKWSEGNLSTSAGQEYFLAIKASPNNNAAAEKKNTRRNYTKKNYV